MYLIKEHVFKIIMNCNIKFVLIVSDETQDTSQNTRPQRAKK